MANIIWIDIESTYIDPRTAGIWQFAYIIEIDGKVVKSNCINMKPRPKDIVSAQALDIGGVTWDEVKAFPDYMEAFDRIYSDIEFYKISGKWILGGFNSQPFDLPLLMSWWGTCTFARKSAKKFFDIFHSTTLDARILAIEYLLPEVDKLQDHKLITIGKRLLGADNVDESKAHNALFDASLARKIYHTIKSSNGN